MRVDWWAFGRFGSDDALVDVYRDSLTHRTMVKITGNPDSTFTIQQVSMSLSYWGLLWKLLVALTQRH